MIELILAILGSIALLVLLAVRVQDRRDLRQIVERMGRLFNTTPEQNSRLLYVLQNDPLYRITYLCFYAGLCICIGFGIARWPIEGE